MGKFRNFLLRDMAEEPKSAEQKRHEDFVLGKDDLALASDDSSTITERSAMRISSVYSCVRVLSEDFA